MDDLVRAVGMEGISRSQVSRLCAEIDERLAACIADPRAAERVQHGLAEIIRFRMLMIAAGYEDGNDADSLRHDPMFKLALDRLPEAAALCSQPTISRTENRPDRRALLRMGRAMVEFYCASFRQVPRCITLDIDDTFDAVHGGQQLRLFNAHHDDYGFQPIVVFDGEGRTALTRGSSSPTSPAARRVLSTSGPTASEARRRTTSRPGSDTSAPTGHPVPGPPPTSSA